MEKKKRPAEDDDDEQNIKIPSRKKMVKSGKKKMKRK
jgi:hypothetical protein